MDKIKLSFIVIMISALGGFLAAQDFSGSIEARLGWYWGSKELAPLAQVFSGAVAGKVGEADQPAAQYEAGLEVSYDPATALSTPELGEAWVKFFAGPFDISVGNQVVAWGGSDVFVPSDAVNPVDLSLPVDPAKMPVPMGRLVYNGDFLTLDLVAQPYWISPRLPGAPWAQPLQISTEFAAVDPSWDNVSYGGHLKASLGLLQGLDIGLTAYRGRDYRPTATVILDASYNPVSITLSYDRLTLLAADLVFAPGGGLLLKTEWGYRTLRDSSLLEPEAGAAKVQGVSGFEYRLGGVQLIGEHVLDWAKGGAAGGDSVKQSLVGIASLDLGSRTNLKVAAIYDLDGDGMVGPQASYTLADGLKLEGSAFLFFGASDTTYGAWKDNSLGRFSLKYSF